MIVCIFQNNRFRINARSDGTCFTFRMPFCALPVDIAAIIVIFDITVSLVLQHTVVWTSGCLVIYIFIVLKLYIGLKWIVSYNFRVCIRNWSSQVTNDVDGTWNIQNRSRLVCESKISSCTKSLKLLNTIRYLCFIFCISLRLFFITFAFYLQKIF